MKMTETETRMWNIDIDSPPLCLNCRNSVIRDMDILCIQKILLFQTYAEMLNVKDRSMIPDWWDFNTEGLPFCEFCFLQVKELRDLCRKEKKENQEILTQKIRQIVTTFKIKMLTSRETKFSPSYDYYHRDHIFRELSILDFLPIVRVSNVDLEQNIPCASIMKNEHGSPKTSASEEPSLHLSYDSTQMHTLDVDHVSAKNFNCVIKTENSSFLADGNTKLSKANDTTTQFLHPIGKPRLPKRLKRKTRNNSVDRIASISIKRSKNGTEGDMDHNARKLLIQQDGNVEYQLATFKQFEEKIQASNCDDVTPRNTFCEKDLNGSMDTESDSLNEITKSLLDEWNSSENTPHHLDVEPSSKQNQVKPVVGRRGRPRRNTGKWINGRIYTIDEDGNKFLEGVEVIKTEKGFQCGDCRSIHYCEKALASHIRLSHISAEKLHFCDHCNKAFSTNNALSKHTTITHAKGRPFLCDACSASFKSKGSLNDHFKRVHLKLRFASCDICGKKFYRKKDCKVHRETRHRDYTVP